MVDLSNNNNTKRKRNHNNSKRKNKKSKPNPKRRNWIESCSESIDRIPSNSAAPLCCVVSRVELVEEQLLPLANAVDEKEAGARKEDSNDKDAVVDAGVSDTVAKDLNEADETKESSTDASETMTNRHESQNKLAAVAAGHVTKKETDADESEHDTQATSQQIALLKRKYASTVLPFRIRSTIQIDGKEKNIFIPVKRDASANGPTQWQLKQKQSKKSSRQSYHQHLPNGDNGDGIPNPHPKHLVPDKFWAQRKRLFSKYDEGIQIEDGEMWYSVTPEVIAGHVADKMVKMVLNCREKSNECEKKDEIVVLDAFCGCGGNAIAFAKKNNVRVIAVDNNLGRLRMAANNAKVYGVDSKNIVFVHADVVDVLSSYTKGSKCIDSTKAEAKDKLASGYEIGGLELLPDSIDAIFLSPPWGGMGYESNDTFDPISSITIQSKHQDGQITTTNGGELFNMSASAVLSNANGVVAYFLPRNVDGIKLGQVAVASSIDHECFELEQNVVNGKVKTVTAYFGSCLTK